MANLLQIILGRASLSIWVGYSICEYRMYVLASPHVHMKVKEQGNGTCASIPKFMSLVSEADQSMAYSGT